MGPSRLLIGAMAGLVGGQAASATPLPHLDDARAAIAAEERRSVRDSLDAAEQAFGQSESVVLNDVLARYWYYRGLQFSRRGASPRTLDAFRQALVVDNTFEWDRDLNQDRELRKVFEALRGEVIGREQRQARVPERTGCAVAYVDGSRVGASSTVSIGLRLAQVQCPKGDVYSQWFDFGSDETPIDWLALCPYSIDTSIEPYVAPESDDDFAGLDGGWDEPSDSEEDPCFQALAAGLAEVTTESTPTEVPQSGTSIDEGVTEANQNGYFSTWSTRRKVVAGSGVALVGAGTVMHFAVVKPSFAMVEFGRRNNEWITEYAAGVLTDRFVQRRAATRAVTGVGAALITAGVIWVPAQSTRTVQPLLLPTGAGLHGRF